MFGCLGQALGQVVHVEAPMDILEPVGCVVVVTSPERRAHVVT